RQYDISGDRRDSTPSPLRRRDRPWREPSPFFFSSRRRHTRSVSAFLLNRSSDLKLSKYNVDDVALGVCKTGAEEAGVTEVRTSLSEKKFELWREIKV